MDEVGQKSTRPQRFNTVLIGSFASIAVLLAALGIGGVLATSVSRRTQEIGIRMVLGARRPDVVRMILRQGLTIAAAGLLLGGQLMSSSNRIPLAIPRSPSILARSCRMLGPAQTQGKSMSITRRSASVAAALVLGVVGTVVVSANHSWGGYHWARTESPFTLKTGDNVDSRWDAFLDEAISDWNQSAVLDLQKVAGGAKPRNCRPTAGRIEVCNASYGTNGWLGIAQIWITGGTHITQGTTKLNDSYFNTTTYDTPAWRRLVTCQEVAHDFGLDHQDENFSNPNLGTCMDYTSDPDGGGAFGPTNEHPNAHDFEELSLIYSHVDNVTTAGSSLPNGTPSAMSDIELEGPNQWGKLVRASRNNRVQVFEADFGRGHKVITHVFWADPEADSRGR